MVSSTCPCTCTEKHEDHTSLHALSFNMIPTPRTRETGFLSSFFCQLCLHLRVFRCTHSEESNHLLKPQRRLFQGRSRYRVNQSVDSARLARTPFCLSFSTSTERKGSLHNLSPERMLRCTPGHGNTEILHFSTISSACSRVQTRST